MTIRLILIDDDDRFHSIISDLLRSVDDIALVGQGYDGAQAVELCALYQPDLVLMDVKMRQIGGEDATGLVRSQFPQIKVLILSSYSDADLIYRSLRNGASGYVVKDVVAEDLIPTIRTVHVGQMVLSSTVMEKLVSQSVPTGDAAFGLTARESEILTLMAQGKGNLEISHELQISKSTVKFHVKNILAKLDSQTRSEALVVAAKNDLI